MKNFRITLLACITFVSIQIFAAEAPVRPEIEITESTPVQELKNYIRARYNPSDTDCGAAISVASRKVYKDSYYNRAREFACLLLGKRSVIFSSFEELKLALALDPQEYGIFEKVAKAENIKELEGYVYRPEGVRNVMLLIKNDKIAGVGGHYLMGYLLGYKEEDIEFFHQRLSFDTRSPGSYNDFSPEAKNKFTIFKRDVWPHSQGYVTYELTKKSAHKWLEDNKRFSNEQLSQQIQAVTNKRGK